MVPRFHRLFALFVFSRVRFRLFDHLLDLIFTETTRGSDLDRLFFSRAKILCGHMNDSVRVDVECDLDLWNAAWRHRNTDEIELAQKFIIRGHFTFALENSDRDGSLVVLSRRKNLALLGRYCGVAFDQLGEHTTECLDSEGKGRNVQEQHVLDFTLQHGRLNRCAYSNDLIRIDATVRLFSENLSNSLLHCRHPGHSADQNDFMDFARAEARIFQSLPARSFRPVDQIRHQRLDLRPAQLYIEMLRALLIGGDKRQIDI